MNFEKLLNGYWDESLSVGELQELGRLVADRPELARRFAESARLHNQLHDYFSANCAWSPSGVESAPPPAEAKGEVEAVGARFVRGRRWALTVGMAAALILVFWFAQPPWNERPVRAAMTAWERILAASRQPKDRTYLIGDPDWPDSVTRGPDAEAAPIHGAVLSVRGLNQYVLVRKLADGQEFRTGSDGVVSWAIPPRGPVRVSSDPRRFRGVLPGQQHQVPFLNGQEDLQTLEAAYDLQSAGPGPEFAGSGWMRFDAVRKAHARGGPKQISLWYDPNTGVIHRFLFERLPQAKGGPNRLVLDLRDEADLGPNYYHHSAHHDDRRTVVREPNGGYD